MWKKLALGALIAAAVAALIRVFRPRPDFATPVKGSADWAPLDLAGPQTDAAETSRPEDSVEATPEDSVEATPEDSVEATPEDSTDGWVEPNEDGSCPGGYPVKVKLSSGIFHVPGGLSYERTRPDRCYANAAAAEGDGFRQSQR